MKMFGISFRRSPLSFRAQLTFILGAFTVLSMVVLGGVAYRHFHQIVRQNALQKLAIVADAHQEALVGHLTRQHERAGQFLVVARARCGHGPAANACVQTMLEDFITTEGGIHGTLALRGFPTIQTGEAGLLTDASLPPPQQLAEFHADDQQYVVRETQSGDSVAMTFAATEIRAIFKNGQGLGRTGETFLTDSRGVYIIPPRADTHPLGRYPTNALPLEPCLAGAEGEVLHQDARGLGVIHSYRPIAEIGGGCIIVHMDQDEAFAPVASLRREVAGMASMFGALAIVLSFVLARTLAKPIDRLTTRVRALQAGDFESAVPAAGPSEVRTFAETFDSMARSLKASRLAAEDAAERVRRYAGQLGDERRRLEAVLRQMPAGVVIAEAPSGRLLLVNAQFTQIAQQNDLPPTFEDVDRLSPGPGGGPSAPGRWPLGRSLRDGEVVVGEEIETRRRDGTSCTLSVSSAPIRDGDGSIVAGVMTVQDITERKRAEQEIQKTSKLESIGILAGGIAHDFNNLLTAVIGNIALAKTLAPADDPVLGRLVEATKACLQAQSLTQQLLTFSRGGAPIIKTVSLTALLGEWARFALTGSSVRLDVSIPPDLWPVEADEGQINQVINNLVINAKQAMPNGGPLTIHAQNVAVGESDGLPLDEGCYVRIAITDRGTGIAPADLAKIFDPFFTTKSTGSGLGLTTSYAVIKKHKGHITVTSQLGLGSTFVIYLPASPHAITASRGTRAAVAGGRGKILVMDDDASIRDILNGLMPQFGYTVECVEEGKLAVERYQRAQADKEPFDVVILDLTVPRGLGGKETIKRLAALDPTVRAIVSSGYSNDPVLADYRRYGFIARLAKPFEVEDLHRLLSDIIGSGMAAPAA